LGWGQISGLNALRPESRKREQMPRLQAHPETNIAQNSIELIEKVVPSVFTFGRGVRPEN